MDLQGYFESKIAHQITKDIDEQFMEDLYPHWYVEETFFIIQKGKIRNKRIVLFSNNFDTIE